MHQPKQYSGAKNSIKDESRWPDVGRHDVFGYDVIHRIKGANNK